MDDFDDLFGGIESGGYLGAEGAGADVLDELVDDGEVDVGLEEGEADLAKGLGDVLVGDGALAAEVLEGTLEFVAEVFKHDSIEFISDGGVVCGEEVVGVQVATVVLARWVRVWWWVSFHADRRG